MELFLGFFGLAFCVWLSLRLSNTDKFDAPSNKLDEQPATKHLGTQPARSEQRIVKPIQPKPPEHTTVSGAAYVIDGDSLVIQKKEIRLFGVDAPEFNHPYGKKAKWALVKLCKGQKIKAEVKTTDDHGRLVAQCFLPDGRDLSAEMVKQGFAIDWPKFSGGAYRQYEVSDARKKMWLADARQKGRMHVWRQYEARKAAEKA